MSSVGASAAPRRASSAANSSSNSCVDSDDKSALLVGMTSYITPSLLLLKLVVHPLGEGGEVVLERRVRTQRERLGELLSKRPKARVLLEASTGSEWVARYLEGLGHEVVVADPNFAPMYATRSRRVKTDKRDARTLAEACKLGAYRPAHRTSEAKRHMRAQLAVREALVRTRTRYIALVSALVRREGLRIADGGRSPSWSEWRRWRCRAGSWRRWPRY